MGKEEREVRFFDLQELRAEVGEDGRQRIQGYAAVFNAPSEDLGGFREFIMPGAFRRSLAIGDQRALWNHNSDYVLGRRKSGTLELAEDEVGLRFVIYPPDAQWAKDALETMKRGDVDQMSFGFWVQVDGEEWQKDEAGKIRRTLKEVNLIEVSPVAFPAYPQTSAFVRSQLEIFAGESQAADPDNSGVARSADAQVRNAIRRRKINLLKMK